MAFKLTYATMFNPPEEMHTRFEEALAGVSANLGQEHGMLIGGKDYFTAEKFEDRSLRIGNPHRKSSRLKFAQS